MISRKKKSPFLCGLVSGTLGKQWPVLPVWDSGIFDKKLPVILPQKENPLPFWVSGTIGKQWLWSGLSRKKNPPSCLSFCYPQQTMTWDSPEKPSSCLVFWNPQQILSCDSLCKFPFLPGPGFLQHLLQIMTSTLQSWAPKRMDRIEGTWSLYGA